jgi:hypothetical protein
MATGYDDYIVYMYSNPPLALERCQQHIVALMQQEGPRVGSDWVTHDSSVLDKVIARARKDLAMLNGVVLGVGAPRAIMTRRVDPGPSVGLSY